MNVLPRYLEGVVCDPSVARIGDYYARYGHHCQPNPQVTNLVG